MRRPERHQAVRAEAGRLPLKLALEARRWRRAPAPTVSRRASSSWVASSRSGFTSGCGLHLLRSAAASRSRVARRRVQEDRPPRVEGAAREDEAEPDRHEAYQQQEAAMPKPSSARRASIGAHRTRSRIAAKTRKAMRAPSRASTWTRSPARPGPGATARGQGHPQRRGHRALGSRRRGGGAEHRGQQRRRPRTAPGDRIDRSSGCHPRRAR